MFKHVVYVCRDSKDALVSSCFFTRKASENYAGSYPLQEAMELLCAGLCSGGPQWPQVVEYWEASHQSTGGVAEVLFLRYEEMLRDPAGNLKRMAEFMGCAFSREEERGVVEATVELFSLEKLKNMEMNRNGWTGSGIKGEAFFQKGVAGDWSSHMTPEMGKMVDDTVEVALRGSGFSFSGEPSTPGGTACANSF